MPVSLGWLRTLWGVVDERLADTSRRLQRIVRLVRVTVVALVIAILLSLASPVVLFLWPDYFPIAYAVSTVILLVPLIVLTVLVALPLRLKSVIRLIDKGYPGNARELAIRVAARKMRDQSIETEELLVETAVNEGRKMYERYQARAAAHAANQAAREANGTPGNQATGSNAGAGDRQSDAPPTGAP